jgi:hypothetical protein
MLLICRRLTLAVQIQDKPMIGILSPPKGQRRPYVAHAGGSGLEAEAGGRNRADTPVNTKRRWLYCEEGSQGRHES